MLLQNRPSPVSAATRWHDIAQTCPRPRCRDRIVPRGRQTPSCAWRNLRECRPLPVNIPCTSMAQGEDNSQNSGAALIRVCVRLHCRREQLPLTCRAFAAACDDIIWDSVRVDARQYKRQTWTAMTWERVEPWLAKRAGNICGIDLRRASLSGHCCNVSCMWVRPCHGWRRCVMCHHHQQQRQACACALKRSTWCHAG